MNSSTIINRINILDTTVTTDNLGDIIIYQAIVNELQDLFQNAYVTNTSTHDSIGDVGRKAITSAPISLMMGTNVLTSRYRVNRKGMWRVTSKDVKALNHKVLLCGTGWKNSNNKVSLRQKHFYKKILNPDLLHSVRDSQAESALHSIGINNVINTSCPTLWSLSEELCKKIPKSKAKNVVFTLTRHKPAPTDIEFIKILLDSYNAAYFWPQQIEDLDYLKKITPEKVIKKIKLIQPSILAFNDFLEKNETDFVGTRLHGGVRALQYAKRTIIIAIDNRATEITKDTNLTTVERNDNTRLDHLINTAFETKISIPTNNIERWKANLKDQFTLA